MDAPGQAGKSEYAQQDADPPRRFQQDFTNGFVTAAHIKRSIAAFCSTGNSGKTHPLAETSPHQFPRAGLRLETVKILLAHRRSLVKLFSHRCAGSTFAS